MSTKAGTTQTGGTPKNAPASAKVAKSRGTPFNIAEGATPLGPAPKTGNKVAAPFVPTQPAKGNGPDPAALVVEKMYRPPNILRLHGIRLADFKPPEDTLDERLLEGVDDAEGGSAPLGAGDVPYDKIPSEFTGLEDWPASTNLKCWVCDFNFSDRPKFVALSFKENEAGGYKMGVHGVMCTFNCAELYIETRYQRLTERQHLQELLRFEYFFFTAKWVSRIKPAPPKTEMLQYGGPLDSDAFLKKLRELDPEHGLRDHTPGSIIPERLRINPGDVSRAAAFEAPVSVWDLCSIPAPSAVQRGDSASVWQLLGPGETKPGEAKPSEMTPEKEKPDDAKLAALCVAAKTTELFGVDVRAGGRPANPTPVENIGGTHRVALSEPQPNGVIAPDAKPKKTMNGFVVLSTPPLANATPITQTSKPADQEKENPKPAHTPKLSGAPQKTETRPLAPAAKKVSGSIPLATKPQPATSKVQLAATKAQPPCAEPKTPATTPHNTNDEHKEKNRALALDPSETCDYLDELLG